MQQGWEGVQQGWEGVQGGWEGVQLVGGCAARYKMCSEFGGCAARFRLVGGCAARFVRKPQFTIYLSDFLNPKIYVTLTKHESYTTYVYFLYKN